MKIVVLDGFTTSGYDLSFDTFKKYGELEVYDETKPCDIVKRCENAEIVISNKTAIKSEHFKRMNSVRFIDLISTGYDAIDVASAREFNIDVANVPSYSESAVAQCTFSHILNISNRYGMLCDEIRKNGWEKTKDDNFKKVSSFELSGKTLGLFGFGRIAKKVASIALSFDMNVIATARNKFSYDNVTQVSFNSLLDMSDIISIHTPCTDETFGIINKENIAKMKDGVILINTARGRIINEPDLIDALKSGKVSFFGGDVLYDEPTSKNNQLLKLENSFITPHIAWAPKQTRQRLIDEAEKNLRAFLDGNPINIIN